MSAYGFLFFPLLRDPKGLANTVGAAHPRSPRGRGAGKQTLGRFNLRAQALRGLLRKP